MNNHDEVRRRGERERERAKRRDADWENGEILGAMPEYS